MPKNILNNIKKNASFQKANKKLGNTTARKTNKPHYDKTVQITTPAYNRLRLYSFKNNIHIAAIVTKAVNDYLDDQQD